MRVLIHEDIPKKTYSTLPNCPACTPIFFDKKSTLHALIRYIPTCLFKNYRIVRFAPPKIIEQRRTRNVFYLFEQPLIKLKNICLNMFKKFPTKMAKVNIKVSQNRSTRLLQPTFLFNFRIFHPTTLIRCYTYTTIRYCKVIFDFPNPEF